MPVERLSHVYVAFGGICGDNPGAYKEGEALGNMCNDLHEGSSTGNYWLPELQHLSTGEISFFDDMWGYADHQLTAPDGTNYK